MKKSDKQLFIERLKAGDAPGQAARFVNLARSAAYKWRDEDEDFKQQWIDAVDTALDQLETDLYKIAHDDKNPGAIMYILSHRRKTVYGGVEEKPKEDEQAKLEDARQVLLQLGYMPAEIEGDYEEVDATSTSDSQGTA